MCVAGWRVGINIANSLLGPTRHMSHGSSSCLGILYLCMSLHPSAYDGVVLVWLFDLSTFFNLVMLL